MFDGGDPFFIGILYKEKFMHILQRIGRTQTPEDIEQFHQRAQNATLDIVLQKIHQKNTKNPVEDYLDRTLGTHQCAQTTRRILKMQFEKRTIHASLNKTLQHLKTNNR